LAIVLAFPAAQSRAQDVVKVGIVMPMTGSFAAAGRQVLAGISLFMRQNGDSVAGKKIQLIVKDDASVPDLSKRMAQELIITDHVSVMGVGLTPNALAIAPLSREAKIPTVLMISGTSTVTEASPYIVRTSFTLGQQSGIIAEWAVKNGSSARVRRSIHEWRRTNPRNHQGAGGESGLRTVPSRVRANQGAGGTDGVTIGDFEAELDARRDLGPDSIRPGERTSGNFRTAVRRARPRQGWHQTDRDRGPDR
jgi:hypothetical protein